MKVRPGALNINVQKDNQFAASFFKDKYGYNTNVNLHKTNKKRSWEEVNAPFLKEDEKEKLLHDLVPTLFSE